MPFYFTVRDGGHCSTVNTDTTTNSEVSIITSNTDIRYYKRRYTKSFALTTSLLFTIKEMFPEPQV